MARNARRTFWTAVMAIAALVFVCAMANLGLIAYSYWSDSNRYDEISDTAFTPAEEVDALADMKVDWKALRAINPDVIAWVYVPDTPISYPVCWRKDDNQTYLDVNFDGAHGVFTGAGAIFLDGEAKPDFSCPVNFLFGHHMNDGSMFACLSDFADAGVFGEHREVYLLTPDYNYQFTTFALVRTVGTDYLVMHDFANEAERVKYIADKEERSLATPDEGSPNPKQMGKLLALSTCDYNEADGRAVLFASLVDAVEPAAKASNVVGDAEGYAAG
ncbi:MAG: class B sortase [Coriobacteriaceae bacterium]|nr:class B sortase [Coriobacteriaceae bacterium]